MKGKVLIGVCATGMLLALGLLIGANPSPRTAAQWEYGVFLHGHDGFQWNHEGQLVVGKTAAAFIEKMGLPRDVPTSARKDALQRTVLDYLGRQGWELVQVVHDDDMPSTTFEEGTYRHAYWLKRPR
jgi:hypothetical protein